MTNFLQKMTLFCPKMNVFFLSLLLPSYRHTPHLSHCKHYTYPFFPLSQNRQKRTKYPPKKGFSHTYQLISKLQLSITGQFLSKVRPQIGNRKFCLSNPQKKSFSETFQLRIFIQNSYYKISRREHTYQAPMFQVWYP